MARTRRCRVFAKGAFHEAQFHTLERKITYGSDNEPREYMMALVELPDGTMVNIEPAKVQYLDPLPDEEDEPSEPELSLLAKVERLKGLLVERARGVKADVDEYNPLRRELVATPIKEKLPSFVIACRTIQEFWNFIQPKIPSYKERDAFLQQEFEPVLSYLESDGGTTGDRFRDQFPAGLPFSLTKPHVVVRPHGGKQLVTFEDSADVGVLRSGVYPSLTFSGFQTALDGTPIAAQLKTKLVAIIQTEHEKTFFKEYATAYSMGTAEVPMLVPQAWIQWHSQKKDDLRAAGSSYADDLYRVDFVAFWNNRRFAILVDDIGHYAVKKGDRWDANETQYSNRLKEDRKLRKEGWDVFRVSNWEIRNNGLPEILTDLREFLRF